MSRFNDKISIAQVFYTSLKLYKTQVDNKARRAQKDIRSAKIINKNNFEYNRSTKTWEQTGRSSKLVIEVRSDPRSYPAIDTIRIHKYPIVFEFQDIFKGAETPFKWREGSQKKPVFKVPGKDSQDIADINIRAQIQMQFFFDMVWVAKQNNLLWGICHANRPPSIRNPKKLIYFGKHAYWAVKNIVIPLLSSDKLKQGVVKNKYRQD